MQLAVLREEHQVVSRFARLCVGKCLDFIRAIGG
jgi:hypothetical protein